LFFEESELLIEVDLCWSWVHKRFRLLRFIDTAGLLHSTGRRPLA
jgi:hypothetical protein